MNNSQKSVALVEKMANIPWQQFPGHFGGALSKALVGPDNVGTEKIDFRISRYAPAAFVEEHVHQIQEQVYYVLEGEGVLTTDDQKHLMRPHDYVYVPPGVRHSFANTGTNGLVFLVITTPTHDGEVR
jgi:mannose-6-phosphate isomerase-like protein (cupin superfamily)